MDDGEGRKEGRTVGGEEEGRSSKELPGGDRTRTRPFNGRNERIFAHKSGDRLELIGNYDYYFSERGKKS